MVLSQQVEGRVIGSHQQIQKLSGEAKLDIRQRLCRFFHSPYGSGFMSGRRSPVEWAWFCFER